ncbi:InlB B-repeat-containing protein, partial [Treponema sp.]|uniref:InlB B-repeat-containing protein n=1 Tax=Treponema sp. TaxID=166 RepID=UPI003FA248F4
MQAFLADPEEFFSYWAAEVMGTDSVIDKPTQTIGGVLCVPSANDVTVTIKLKNPKNFRLVTPASAANTQDVISFPGHSPQPDYGNRYTLEQTAAGDKLILTYKPLFLKDYEWSTKDIGADITFVSTDGRTFSKKFSMNLKVNTPPPKPTAVLAQTNSASPTYVLCLEVPDMGVSVTGGKLHKDIAQIEINGTPYELTLNGTTTDFVKPADTHFITAVTQLAGYPVPPSGNWVLYYDTQLPVGNAYRAYTVKLKDNKGLVSETLETGTARPQLPAETVNITRGQQSTGSGLGGTTGDPIIINGETSAPEAQITIQNIAGTTVHCTVQEVVGGSATGAVSPYDGNPVNVPLGLGTANEKIYEVKYHTDGTGYTPTSTTIKYYKVLKCHSVTFHANGGTFTDGSTTSTSRTVLVPHGTVAAAPVAPNVPTRAGYTLGSSWYTEAACTTQWNFTTPITANITLYAQWAPNSGTSYRVEHY